MALTWTNLDIMKVTLKWQVGTVCLSLNVFQAQLAQSAPHPLTTFTVLEDAGIWMDAFLTPFIADVVVSVDFLGADVHKLVGSDWVYAGTATVTASPGSIGDPLPSGVAMLLNASTDTARVHGRKFVPGLSELAQTASVWTVTVLGHMVGAMEAWITPWNSVDLLSSMWYPGLRIKNLTFVGFNGAYLIRSIPAYQRRRKEGVGV